MKRKAHTPGDWILINGGAGGVPGEGGGEGGGGDGISTGGGKVIWRLANAAKYTGEISVVMKCKNKYTINAVYKLFFFKGKTNTVVHLLYSTKMSSKHVLF